MSYHGIFGGKIENVDSRQMQEYYQRQAVDSDEMRMRVALRRIADLDLLDSEAFEEKYGTEGPCDPYVIAVKVLQEIGDL